MLARPVSLCWQAAPGLREQFRALLLRRKFRRIWPGVSAEAVARGNRMPAGTWRVREYPGGRGIEVAGWFIAETEV
jgi:hypothetical protein